MPMDVHFVIAIHLIYCNLLATSDYVLTINKSLLHKSCFRIFIYCQQHRIWVEVMFLLMLALRLFTAVLTNLSPLNHLGLSGLRTVSPQRMSKQVNVNCVNADQWQSELIGGKVPEVFLFMKGEEMRLRKRWPLQTLRPCYAVGRLRVVLDQSLSPR